MGSFPEILIDPGLTCLYYTHSMIDYICTNLLVTFLRKVGSQSKRQMCMEMS